MTYRELLYKATRLCDKGEITLGEYGEMTKPLDREVEQEDVLDKIKEEIKDNTYFINETTEKEGIYYETVEKIIDKYKK